MQPTLIDSLIETLFEKYLNQKDGEVPWFMVYLYLTLNTDRVLYSFSSPVFYRSIRYIGGQTFLSEMYLNDEVIYSANSECPYIAGERFCVTLKLARERYNEGQNKETVTDT